MGHLNVNQRCAFRDSQYKIWGRVIVCEALNSSHMFGRIKYIYFFYYLFSIVKNAFQLLQNANVYVSILVYFFDVSLSLNNGRCDWYVSFAVLIMKRFENLKVVCFSLLHGKKYKIIYKRTRFWIPR